jgi:hypothetical protein
LSQEREEKSLQFQFQGAVALFQLDQVQAGGLQLELQGLLLALRLVALPLHHLFQGGGLGLGLQELGLQLVDLFLEGGGVQAHQHLALLHLGAVLDDVDDLAAVAAHLRAQDHGLGRLQLAHGAHPHLEAHAGGALAQDGAFLAKGGGPLGQADDHKDQGQGHQRGHHRPLP